MSGFPKLPPQAPRSAPRSTPSNQNSPNLGASGMPNSADNGSFNQTSGFSEQQKIQRSVAKSKQNSGVLKAVKLTRQQLEQWLAGFGLKLLTSSVELQMTHNFINSSYVVYPDGSRISLPMFLKQTDPSIQAAAEQINQQMSGIASHLQVVDPNANINPFESQFNSNFPTNPIFNSQFNQLNQTNQPNQQSNPNFQNPYYPNS